MWFETEMVVTKPLPCYLNSLCPEAIRVVDLNTLCILNFMALQGTYNFVISLCVRQRYNSRKKKAELF
jgi:hypothetical protein